MEEIKEIIMSVFVGLVLLIVVYVAFGLPEKEYVNDNTVKWCQTICKNQVLSYTIKGEEKTCECKE